jgi:hypothetical protein
MPDVNWLAVLAATFAAFVLGGLWYSPLLLGKQWQAAAGLSDAQLAAGNKALIFGGSFVLAFIASWMFAMFLGRAMGLHGGAAAGLAAGLCWVGTSFGINALFEHRPLRLTLINAGYHTLQFTAIGAIIGAMG